MNLFTLFDYQEEMVCRVQKAFGMHQSVMVQMPTGTGKTYLLAAVVRSEELRVKNPCVWIVAHRRELVEQIEETLAKFGLATASNKKSSISKKASLSQDSSISTLHSTLIRVMSIQWLSLHYRELSDEPSLIVIDEAHHAVAKTYAGMMQAFPGAKKLGLTATPYRLNGRGFTDLFDVLLTSWSMERFIAKGRLSMYDYYSIKPDSDEQLLVDSLKKRGADGDFQLKEMNEVMDVRPSIERLCMTVKRYVPRNKGIVYAISIAHAEHIAEYYRQNGINAVAISSKTPPMLRKELLEMFKKSSVPSASSLKNFSSLSSLPSSLPENSSLSSLHSSLPIQVLVSVDLFSEGFDCPDVEFIQLARPTLSLSKYLQMVGRGLRKNKGKRYCVILDNVGLYRRFGMPSADRNWQLTFNGKSSISSELHEACMRINDRFYHLAIGANDNEEMMMIYGHKRQQQMIKDSNDDSIEKDADGWIDHMTGIRFKKRPECISIMGIDFITDDGIRLFPHIRSKFIDDKAYLNLKTLELQVGCGINWKRRFISWHTPNKVYHLKDKCGSVRLYVDDEDSCYAQGNPDLPLQHIHTQEEMNDYCQKYSRSEKAALQTLQKRYHHGLLYPINSINAIKHDDILTMAHDIWYVAKDVYGESYWADGITGMKHYDKPILQQRGFVWLLKEADWYFIRNIPDLADKPLRNWQIVADNNICVVDNDFLFLKQSPRLWFKILKRADDFSYFVVKDSRLAEDNSPDIIITQVGNGELKMESKGVKYTPHY